MATRIHYIFSLCHSQGKQTYLHTHALTYIYTLHILTHRDKKRQVVNDYTTGCIIKRLK